MKLKEKANLVNPEKPTKFASNLLLKSELGSGYIGAEIKFPLY